MEISNSNTISIPSKNKEFIYDNIEDENSTQKDTFEHCGKKICDFALEGYNTTIFAYGQTGSGKTYTLLGKHITNKINIRNENVNIIDDMLNIHDEINNINSYDINDEKIGLLPRILYYLFQNSSNEEKGNKFTFKISYMEIYKERLIDLLYPDNKEKVQLSDINGKIEFKNLRKLYVNTPQEAIKYIIDGNHFRHNGSTLMNKESSRSHAIISIYIENNIIEENKIKKSVFHIIDLAGSERQKKAGTESSKVKEAGNINKSLMNLSKVIREIINKDKQISYRDSKLTHVLRDSLGGNAKTSIIATISQLEYNLDETISTLTFAQNAKKVKNNPVINEEISINNAKIIKDKFLELQKDYEQLRERYKNQENIINEKELLAKKNEDINKMMNDILDKEEKELRNLREENAELKDKIEKSDIYFKLKIEELNNEKNKVISENKELKNMIFDIRNLFEEIYNSSEKIMVPESEPNKKIKEMEIKIEELEKENKEVIAENKELKNIIFDIRNLLEEMNFDPKDNSIEEMEKPESNKIMKKMEIKIEKLEKENKELKEKYYTSQKSISEYLDKIPELNKQNLTLEKEKKELILQKEDLEKKIAFLVEHFSNILKNNDLVPEKNYFANQESSINDYYQEKYNGIISGVDKLIKELRYYNKEYVYDLDQGTKSFIDLYGIRTIISYVMI